MISVKPIRTIPLSITGEWCALQCDHCKAHFLKNMTNIDNLSKRLELNFFKSILVSGGYNKEGYLPFSDSSINLMKKLKESGYKLNFHIGLIDEKIIKNLISLPDMVSYDLMLDDFVIKNIFHLKDKSSADFKEKYYLIKEYFPISPHILIGANYGKIEKEYEEIDFLSKDVPEKIIFIVITPIQNTPFQEISLPSIKEIEELWNYAKKKLPNTKFYLGCVRPNGNYRYELDSLAIDLKFHAIVNPHSEAIKSQNNIKIFEECCALL